MLERYPEYIGCGHPMTMLWENNSAKKEILGFIADCPLKMKNKIFWAHWWIPSEAFLFRNVYKGREELINNNFFDDNLITCYFLKHGDIIYIPDNMVVYRQILDSSWNHRSALQKAVVNMGVYSEAKKIIPEMKLQCFMKGQASWRRFYINRNIDIESECNVEAVRHEPIVRDTLEYHKAGLLYKIRYELKYFVPVRMGLIIRVIRKLKKYRYEKL